LIIDNNFGWNDSTFVILSEVERSFFKGQIPKILESRSLHCGRDDIVERSGWHYVCHLERSRKIFF